MRRGTCEGGHSSNMRTDTPRSPPFSPPETPARDSQAAVLRPSVAPAILLPSSERSHSWQTNLRNLPQRDRRLCGLHRLRPSFDGRFLPALFALAPAVSVASSASICLIVGRLDCSSFFGVSSEKTGSQAGTLIRPAPDGRLQRIQTGFCLTNTEHLHNMVAGWFRWPRPYRTLSGVQTVSRRPAPTRPPRSAASTEPQPLVTAPRP